MTHDTSGGGWREFWLGLDRWLNTWFGGKSLETISSRAGRAVVHGHWWAAWLCRGLSLFERDHCAKAAEHDPMHARAIPPPPLTPEERRVVRRLADKARQRGGRRAAKSTNRSTNKE